MDENNTPVNPVADAWDSPMEGDSDPIEDLVKGKSEPENKVEWTDEAPEDVVSDEPEDIKVEPEGVKKDPIKEEASIEGGKIYKAKFGDKLVEFPDLATIKIKANGKFITPTFKEIKDNYAGKVAWDEKLEALNEKNKSVAALEQNIKSNLENVGKYVKQMQEMATQGDVFGALEAIGNMAGVDTSKFIETFHQAFEQYFDQYVSLDDTQKELQLLKRKAALAEKTLDRSRAEKAEQAEVQKVTHEIQSLQKQYGVTEDELRGAYQTISKARNGNMDGITPQHLVSFSLDGRILDSIYSVAEEGEYNVSKQDVEYIFDVVKAEQKKAGTFLKDSDYKEILAAYTQYKNGEQPKVEVVDRKSAEAVNRKVSRSNQPTQKATPVKQEQDLDFSKFESTDDMWGKL